MILQKSDIKSLRRSHSVFFCCCCRLKLSLSKSQVVVGYVMNKSVGLWEDYGRKQVDRLSDTLRFHFRFIWNSSSDTVVQAPLTVLSR